MIQSRQQFIYPRRNFGLPDDVGHSLCGKYLCYNINHGVYFSRNFDKRGVKRVFFEVFGYGMVCPKLVVVYMFCTK